VEEIGRTKESLAMPIYEPRREEDVFRNVTDHNQGPLTADAVKGIFERIIDEMRTLQQMRRQQQRQGEKEC
jgi:chorismate mutase